MQNTVIFEYLELFCYGRSYDEIARMYSRSPRTVRAMILRTARHVGQMGFWKFYPQGRDDILLMRRRLLDRMYQHGLIAAIAA